MGASLLCRLHRARDCLILSSSCGGEGAPEPAKGSWLSLLDELSLLSLKRRERVIPLFRKRKRKALLRRKEGDRPLPFP
ncbi:hypothetical protein MASR2M17_09360 [Aminivibrio sp.]